MKFVIFAESPTNSEILPIINEVGELTKFTHKEVKDFRKNHIMGSQDVFIISEVELECFRFLATRHV